MTDYLLLIYPALFIFVILFRGKIAAKGEFVEEIWGRSQTKMIQAAACIGVVLHHLTQSITNYGQVYHGPITIFSFVGILCTSIFFFFSGYGLIFNGLNNPKYLDTFLLHRLTTVLVPFFAANITYTCVLLYYKNIPMSGSAIIQSIFGILLINSNGWYIVEIFFLYIAFYILFKLFKKKDIAIVILCLVTIFIIRTGYYGGRDDSLATGSHWFKGEWWYNSTIVFILGMLVARFREPIIAFLKKYYRASLIVITVLFFAAFRIEHYCLTTMGYYRESFAIDAFNGKLVTLVSQMVLCLIFTMMILIISMKLTIGNKVLGFIGTISMEMFLFHGLFVKYIFDYTYTNKILMYAIAITCSIATAAAVHYILAPVIKFITGLKKNKDYIEVCERDLLREKRQRKIRRIKFTVAALIVLSAAGFGGYRLYVSEIKEPSECRDELETLKNAKVGDEVLFGRYETSYVTPGRERVGWIVLKKDGDSAMLVSREGLGGSVYYSAHKEVVWKDSNLYKLVNTDMYNDMFSNSEKAAIIDNPDSGDRLSLLTVSEAETLFAGDVQRQLSITDVALNSGTNINNLSKANLWDEKGYRSSWWWLRGEGDAKVTAPIVTVDGIIEPEKKYVNKPSGAVRPVVFVKY